MDFVKLFNSVINEVKPVNAVDSHAKSLDDKLTDLNIDSLDVIMLSIYLGDIYGIEERVMKEMQVITLNDLKVFIEKHAVCIPESIDAAMEKVK